MRRDFSDILRVPADGTSYRLVSCTGERLTNAMTATGSKIRFTLQDLVQKTLDGLWPAFFGGLPSPPTPLCAPSVAGPDLPAPCSISHGGVKLWHREGGGELTRGQKVDVNGSARDYRKIAVHREKIIVSAHAVGFPRSLAPYHSNTCRK